VEKKIYSAALLCDLQLVFEGSNNVRAATTKGAIGN